MQNGTTEKPRDRMSRGLLYTASGGAGFALVYGLIDVLKSDPKALIAMVSQWGPTFGLAIIVIAFMDRRMGELISINRENASAQQQMAQAMTDIAQKDNREAEEQKRLLHYVGTKMEELLTKVDSVSKGRGASA